MLGMVDYSGHCWLGMCLNLCMVSIKLARRIVRLRLPSIVSIFNVLLSFVASFLNIHLLYVYPGQVRRKCSTLSSTALYTGQLVFCMGAGKPMVLGSWVLQVWV